MEEDFKQCSKCKERKPANIEFFHYRKEGKSKLSSSCKICRNSAAKLYRETNPDIIKELSKQSWERHKDKRKISYQNWKAQNKDYGKIYYSKNSDKLKSRAKKYRESLTEEKSRIAKEKSNKRALEWRRKNPQYSKEYAKKYRLKNKERFAVISRNYKAKKKNADGKHTKEEIQEIIQSQNSKCYWCGCSLGKIHIDHVVPLSKGGSNLRSNLVASCPYCNIAKRDKMPEEFIEWINNNQQIKNK